MPILGKLKEFLDANGVAYEVRTHIPAFTAQEIAAAQHVPGREMAKVVILCSGGEFLMAVLPAPYLLDVQAPAEAAGKPALQLASEREFARLFPQCERGGIPPPPTPYAPPARVGRSLARSSDLWS